MNEFVEQKSQKIEKKILISQERYDELERLEALMVIFEINGVDQWEHYDKCHEEYQEYIEEEESKTRIERENEEEAFQTQMRLFDNQHSEEGCCDVNYGSSDNIPVQYQIENYEYST